MYANMTDIYIYVDIYIRTFIDRERERAQMTSIQPSKSKAFSNQNKGHLAFYVYM